MLTCAIRLPENVVNETNCFKQILQRIQQPLHKTANGDYTQRELVTFSA